MRRKLCSDCTSLAVDGEFTGSGGSLIDVVRQMLKVLGDAALLSVQDHAVGGRRGLRSARPRSFAVEVRVPKHFSRSWRAARLCHVGATLSQKFLRRFKGTDTVAPSAKWLLARRGFTSLDHTRAGAKEVIHTAF
jgi:hypothetical protein